MEKTLREKERERKQTKEQVNSPAQGTLFWHKTDPNAWALLYVVWTFWRQAW